MLDVCLFLIFFFNVVIFYLLEGMNWVDVMREFVCVNLIILRGVS